MELKIVFSISNLDFTIKTGSKDFKNPKTVKELLEKILTEEGLFWKIGILDIEFREFTKYLNEETGEKGIVYFITIDGAKNDLLQFSLVKN